MDSAVSLVVRARRPLAGGLLLVVAAPGAGAETFDLEPLPLGLFFDAACGDLVPQHVAVVKFTNRGPDDVSPTIGFFIFHDLDGDGDGDGRFDARTGDLQVLRFACGCGLLPPGRISDARERLDGFLAHSDLPLTLVIDPDGLLAETDETNNVLGGVYACSVVDDGTVPAPDFAVALLSVRVEQTADCGVVAVLDCRAANLGSTSTVSIETWALVDGSPTLSLDLPDLAPTEIHRRFRPLRQQDTSSTASSRPTSGMRRNREFGLFHPFLPHVTALPSKAFCGSIRPATGRATV